MNGSAPHIVFAGGGTGGHLFPGLAVAEQLVRRLPLVRITFAGTGKAFERQQVEAAGFDYLPVPCRPLPRHPLHLPGFLVSNVAGYGKARGFLRRERVSCVVGLGGYASVPMARAAIHKEETALVLLEQNAIAGRATRWLGPSANLVCLAFDQARDSLSSRCAVRVTGNPLRSGFVPGSMSVCPRPHGRGPRLALRDKRTLLILGGSSGARSLNENVPHALAPLRAGLSGWRIVHQSGVAEAESTRQRYAALRLEATVVPLIADMPAALGETGLAVSRAGGTTLAELAATAVPAVLVPYPYAADDHQQKNAEVMAAAGAAGIVNQPACSGTLPGLAGVLGRLLTDDNLRASMSRAMRRLALPNAAHEVADWVLELLRKQTPRSPATDASNSPGVLVPAVFS